jgi:hypothetical protein
MGKKQEFKLTVEEANLLDRIAEATKMDGWFYIDPDLHVHDIEENNVSSDAEGVCLLEDGLAYGLDEPQSGALSPEEIKIVEDCFKRARAAKDGTPAAPSTPSSRYLTIEQILGIVSGLAKSQGSYGRLLDEILNSKRENPEAYEEWARGMEAKNFADALEAVLFFEEGQLPKACPKAKYWSVPVVYEMYGSITVEAGSAEEAYDKVKEHPDEFDLPDEGFYVDDSFRVADDDRENAIGTIEMLSGPDEDNAASGRHTGLTVKATVTFQKWEGDIARFNGEAEFDACDALDSMDDEEIAEVERNDPYALDHVYLRAVSFGQIHGYDGPFEVELDEDNLSDYLEARRNG